MAQDYVDDIVYSCGHCEKGDGISTCFASNVCLACKKKGIGPPKGRMVVGPSGFWIGCTEVLAPNEVLA